MAWRGVAAPRGEVAEWPAPVADIPQVCLSALVSLLSQTHTHLFRRFRGLRAEIFQAFAFLACLLACLLARSPSARDFHRKENNKVKKRDV